MYLFYLGKNAIMDVEADKINHSVFHISNHLSKPFQNNDDAQYVYGDNKIKVHFRQT